MFPVHPTGRSSLASADVRTGQNPGERATVTGDVHPRRGRQHEVILGLEHVAPTHEYATRLIDQPGIIGRGHCLEDAVAQLLEVVVGLRIDDDEIDGQSTQAPVAMCVEELAQGRQTLHAIDGRQHDRHLARQALRPQPGLRSTIARHFVPGRCQGAALKEQLRRQVLEERCTLGRQTKRLQFDLGRRPGKVERTLGRVGVVVPVRQRERRLTAGGDEGGEGHADRLPGVHAHAGAHGEDRVEHRPGRPAQGGAGIEGRPDCEPSALVR